MRFIAIILIFSICSHACAGDISDRFSEEARQAMGENALLAVVSLGVGASMMAWEFSTSNYPVIGTRLLGAPSIFIGRAHNIFDEQINALYHAQQAQAAQFLPFIQSSSANFFHEYINEAEERDNLPQDTQNRATTALGEVRSLVDLGSMELYVSNGGRQRQRPLNFEVQAQTPRS